MTSTQTWKADRYVKNAGFVADLGMPVVDLLAPQANERILDLGCGDGALTAKLADMAGAVVGVDAGEDMIAAARERGLDAHVMNGHELTFDAEFDAVFSNAAMHWMLDPDAVITGVRRALKPGGRFVGEFGGHGNVAAISVALIAALRQRGIDGAKHVPWFFPTADEYRAKLQSAGFVVQTAELIPRPTPLPTDIAGWLDTFGESFFRAVPDDEVESLKRDVIELLKPCLCDQAGNWTADYVRLRFSATLEK